MSYCTSVIPLPRQFRSSQQLTFLVYFALVHITLHAMDFFSANCCFMGIVGVGVGTYNARHMKECLDDTFHIGKKGAVKAKDSAAPTIGKATSKAKEYGNSVNKGVPVNTRAVLPLL